jgi:hypothetical protein
MARKCGVFCETTLSLYSVRYRNLLNEQCTSTHTSLTLVTRDQIHQYTMSLTILIYLHLGDLPGLNTHKHTQAATISHINTYSKSTFHFTHTANMANLQPLTQRTSSFSSTTSRVSFTSQNPPTRMSQIVPKRNLKTMAELDREEEARLVRKRERRRKVGRFLDCFRGK